MYVYQPMKFSCQRSLTHCSIASLVGSVGEGEGCIIVNFENKLIMGAVKCRSIYQNVDVYVIL